MRLAPGSFRVAAIPFGIGLLAALIGVWPVTAVGLILTIAVFGFYRDPTRTPAGVGIVAPADGVITEISRRDDQLHIVTFLNVHHVHVIRAPTMGEIDGVEPVAGTRRPAFLGGAESNAGIEVAAGAWTVMMRAGFLARRVTAYVEEGELIDRGDRLGHIAFGSRVDLFFPSSVTPADLTIRVGDRVYAGQTIIADGESQ